MLGDGLHYNDSGVEAVFTDICDTYTEDLTSVRRNGGDALPSSWFPQQAAVPFVLTPQVCSSPALTLMNWPNGGVA